MALLPRPEVAKRTAKMAAMEKLATTAATASVPTVNHFRAKSLFLQRSLKAHPQSLLRDKQGAKAVRVERDKQEAMADKGRLQMPMTRASSAVAPQPALVLPAVTLVRVAAGAKAERVAAPLRPASLPRSRHLLFP
jgi:hypothetical protein